jgi:hypothetical protein
MKNILVKLYALEKSGIGCISDLEELVAAQYGWSQEELASKYREITEKINATHNYKTSQEFSDLIYKEYITLFFNQEV